VAGHCKDAWHSLRRCRPKAGACRTARREGADVIALDICAPASSSLTYARPLRKISLRPSAVEAEGRKVLAARWTSALTLR